MHTGPHLTPDAIGAVAVGEGRRFYGRGLRLTGDDKPAADDERAVSESWLNKWG